jgi:arylsulfatase A-like enzyme
MNYRANRFLAAGLFVIASATGYGAAPATSVRPNIVLCMTDDQGWGDVGYNGNPILKTPNLDAMAREGVRFDRFYSAQHNCSPTRASVLTGRHPDRYRCYAWGHDLPLREVTIAEVAQARGYATGHFGKWHLGGLPNADGGDGRGVAPSLEEALRHPGHQGFQQWFSAGNFFDNDPPKGTLFRNGKIVDDLRGETSALVMDEALEFIRAQAKSAQPFLAVVWFPSPHWPYRASVSDKAPYAARPDADFLGEVAAVDRAMGRLRAELRRLNVHEHTLVWFNSDNGAAGGTAGGLSGGKGTLLEGGIRVPGIIEWPARVRTPIRTSMPAGTVDIYPTVCAALGVVPENSERLDGISLLPLLEGGPAERPRPLGFQASNTKTAQPIDAAWIDGRWKLLRLGRPQRVGKGNTGETLPPGEYLFDLKSDPTESRDLRVTEPAVFARMKAALDQWQTSVARSAAEYPFAPPTEPPPLLLGGKVRYVILDDALRSPSLRERWSAGDVARFDTRWDFSETGLRGRAWSQDQHPARCGIYLHHTDAIISVAIRLEGATEADVKLDSFTEGQVARLIVRPNGVAVRVPGRRVSQEEQTGVDLISVSAAINTGEWHTFVWELRGSKMVLTMDGQEIGRASHANLSTPKDVFGFNVVGQSASFRDVRVWDTTAPLN